MARFLKALRGHGCVATSVVRLLVTGAGITLVATQIDVVEPWQGLPVADWRMVAIALLIFQGGIFIRAIRWRALPGALGTGPTLLRLVGLYCTGAFSNTFLQQDLAATWYVGPRSATTPMWKSLSRQRPSTACRASACCSQPCS